MVTITIGYRRVGSIYDARVEGFFTDGRTFSDKSILSTFLFRQERDQLTRTRDNVSSINCSRQVATSLGRRRRRRDPISGSKSGKSDSHRDVGRSAGASLRVASRRDATQSRALRRASPNLFPAASSPAIRRSKYPQSALAGFRTVGRPVNSDAIR